MNNKKKILMISYRFPWPEDKGGYNLRVLNFAKILKGDYSIDLLSLCEFDYEVRQKEEAKKIFNNVFLFKKSKTQEYLSAFKSIFTNKPLQVGYYQSEKIKSWLKKNHNNYDILFFFTMRSVGYGEDLDNFKVVDLIDSISLNYKQAENFPGNFWKMIYKMEIPRLERFEVNKILKGKFNRYFISSDFDKNHFKNRSKEKDGIEKLIIIPNGINEKNFQLQEREEEKNSVSFFGKMDTRPNQDAVLFFSKKVFPLIKKDIPDFKFNIIGINPTEEVRNLETKDGIKVTGYIEDPYPLLQKSKIIISPLRFGAGIQNKILEAMALGRAVVASPVSVRGIKEAVAGKHFEEVEIENPEKWASKIVELMKDRKRRNEMGREARKLMEDNYRWEKMGEKLLKSLE